MAWLAIPIAILIYGLLLYDARRSGSPAAGDDQLGLKTVAATLAVLGTWVVANGLHGLLVAILTLDDVWDRLKVALPSLLVGALVVAGAGLVLMGRTNAARFPKAKRLAAGVVALVSGVALVPALVGFLEVLLDWPSWRVVATAFATLVTTGVVFGSALAVLGGLSGVPFVERLGRGGGSAMGQPLGGVAQPVPGQPMQAYPPAAQAYPPATQAAVMQPPAVGSQTMQGFPPPGGSVASQPGQPSQPSGGWPQQ
jgi:hypothetical protein